MNLLLPWLGAARKRGLTNEHIFLIVVLSATSFFDGFDGSIKALALTQIRETFALSKGAASALFAVIYLGALPAMVVTRWADRFGRRRLLIWSVFGYMVFSGLTALAPNAQWFMSFQFIQQLFLVAEAAIVWTMAAEELPADSRGFGFGVLAMNSALGTGLAAIVWGGFLEPNGVSWRWLFVVCIPPLLLVAFLRRRLPESRRFEAARDQGRLAERWHAILAPGIRRWLWLIVITTFLTQLVQQASTFTIDFLQTDRGMSATTANFMLVFAGLPGIPIMVWAGALSDRFGRRLVGCAFAFASVFGAIGFFWLPGGVPVLLPCMSFTIVGQLGAWPVLQTYTSELFPTSLRSSASSWANVAGVLGRSGSLAIAAPLLAITSQSMTATLLGIGPLVAVVLIAVAFPDTHGRELEDITGEDVAISAFH
ncbi:MAG TPA: MFS transporter [Acidimicrobiales bacterium]|jgi:MFS family permease|nr:MFS transporter [Acidimicrobiales bacterium]